MKCKVPSPVPGSWQLLQWAVTVPALVVVLAVGRRSRLFVQVSPGLIVLGDRESCCIGPLSFAAPSSATIPSGTQ